MKQAIITALTDLGFTIDQIDDKVLTGQILSFNNGGFNILIDFRDHRFTVELIERFSQTHIFLAQKFTDADHIVELLTNSYAFEEWNLDKDKSLEQMFKNYVTSNGL